MPLLVLPTSACLFSIGCLCSALRRPRRTQPLMHPQHRLPRPAAQDTPHVRRFVMAESVFSASLVWHASQLGKSKEAGPSRCWTPLTRNHPCLGGASFRGVTSASGWSCAVALMSEYRRTVGAAQAEEMWAASCVLVPELRGQCECASIATVSCRTPSPDALPRRPTHRGAR